MQPTSSMRWTGHRGLQQRRVITPKEKRILAYHEGGHALMAHLMSSVSPVQKATIIARGTALGYTLNLPEEERYLHTKEELSTGWSSRSPGGQPSRSSSAGSRTAPRTTSRR